MKTITFPKKTAKEIVEECDNQVAEGKLLYSDSWYKDEDFYTKETCRPRTVTIPTQIEYADKSYNEVKDKGVMFNFAEIIYMLRESEEFRELLSSENDLRYTWTSSVVSDGKLVDVGYFDSDGVPAHRWEPGYSYGSIGVCFSRSDTMADEPMNNDSETSRADSLAKAIKLVVDSGYQIKKYDQRG